MNIAGISRYPWLMLTHATLIGRQHRLVQLNGQDFALSDKLPHGGCFGLVLDGCGSKWRAPGETALSSSNEVGAKLLGTFAAATLPQLTLTTPLPDLPHTLAQHCLAFLHRFVHSIPFSGEADLIRFVHTQLLCTLVGFVHTPAAAIFFWMGDGYLLHNETVIYLERGNQPDYLAYRLLHGRGHHTPLIHSHTLTNPAHLNCLAVATDGWSEPLLHEVAAAPHSPLSLQRWLNQKAQQRGNFEDDGAIALWQTEAVGLAV